MLIRIISSLVGLPILAVLIILGGPWLAAAIAVVASIGLLEFYQAFGTVTFKGHALVAVFVSAHMVLLAAFGATTAFVVPMLLPVLLMIYTVVQHKARDVYLPIVGGFGFVYIVVMLSTIYLIRENWGIYALCLIFIAAWGCDTGAYFTGKAIGKRTLAPMLSPKKTVEGAIGGSIAATVLGAVFGIILYNLGEISLNYVYFYALITLICSVAAQFGDLAASAIKRQRGVKDFGNIIPGHGGILDRFDSIIFAAPVAYFLLLIIDALYGGTI